MQPARITVTVLAVAALVATASAAGAAGGSPPGEPAPPAEPAPSAAEERTVTLLTGDRVIVRSGFDGAVGVTVEPAPGRDGVAFTQQRTADGDISVIPADAIEDVASGRLDARLFDVTALLADGYDDAAEAELPPVEDAAEDRPAAAETFDLTLEAIDRDGQPTSVVVRLGDPGAETSHEIAVDGEPVTVSLPAGMYDLTTTIFTPDDPTLRIGSLALMTLPDLVLDEDRHVTLDARDAQLLGAEVDSPSADPALRRASLDTYEYSTAIDTALDDFELYVTPTPEVTAYDYRFSYSSTLAEPAPSDGSPARGYFLHLPFEDRVPEPPFRVHDDDLARVDSSLHHSAWSPDDARANMYATARGPDGELVADLGLVIPSPGDRIDFYSAGSDLSWQTRIDSLGFRETDGEHSRTYEAGEKYERRWNAAPFGPVARPQFASWAGGIYADLQPVASSEPGNTGSMMIYGEVQETTTLIKDGVVVGTNTGPYDNTFEVEPDDADWELAYSMTSTPESLATQVDASWTVSAGPDEDGYLPFVSLRVGGAVDLRNRAPAGEPFPVRLTLERADGTRPEPAAGTLEVSYDDGGSWQPAPVQLSGGELTALVPAPPAGTEFASLRASAEDTDGARVEQTVIHAYEVGGPGEPTPTPTPTPTPSASEEPTDDATLPNTGAGSGAAGGTGGLVSLGLALVAGAALLHRYRRRTAA